jgi:hypothetical protein
MSKVGANWNIKGQWGNDKQTVKVNVPVIVFEEDNLHYAYIPSLDLTGYGTTEDEARSSLEIMLSEFFRYTCNKHTLFIELKRLGWKVRKEKKNYQAPAISEQLVSNEQLKDIIDNKVYQTSNFSVNMPAFA